MMCGTDGKGPASHTSFRYCVIYINHMVSKVITIMANHVVFKVKHMFQGQPRTEVDPFYSPVTPRPHFSVRSPILYPELTQTFDSKCYKLFTSNATHIDASFHQLVISALSSVSTATPCAMILNHSYIRCVLRACVQLPDELKHLRGEARSVICPPLR
jgi:hypothetical protein